MQPASLTCAWLLQCNLAEATWPEISYGNASRCAVDLVASRWVRAGTPVIRRLVLRGSDPAIGSKLAHPFSVSGFTAIARSSATWLLETARLCIRAGTPVKLRLVLQGSDCAIGSELAHPFSVRVFVGIAQHGWFLF